MNGRDLTLGLVGALAVGAALGKRGNLNRASSSSLVQVIHLEQFTRTWDRNRDTAASESTERVLWLPKISQAGLLMLDVGPILHQRIEDAEADGVSEDEIVKGLHRDLVQIADYFNTLRFPLRVYRGLNVVHEDVFDARASVEDYGIHWTPNRAIAEAFANGSHDAAVSRRGAPVLLEGVIASPADIDWRDTFSHFLGYSLGYVGNPKQAEEQVVSQSVLDVLRASPSSARGSRAATTAPVVLYHGAQRWEGAPEIVAHRKGHAEHGPGIYLTTSYETAARYAKGGGSVYRMELRPGVRWLQDAKLDKEPVLRWLRDRPRLRDKERLVAGIERVAARTGGSFPAEILVNQFVNANASSGQHGPALAAFLVANGVDASLVSAGGGGLHGEDWVVLFNPALLRSVTKVPAREAGKTAPFDLPRVKR